MALYYSLERIVSTEKFTKENFINRLNALVQERLEGNWAELSRITGLAPSAIHKIKNGTDPKLSSLERICEALDTSMDWLVYGTEAGESEQMPPRIKAMCDMLYNLPEQQQKEILFAVEEKKQIYDLKLEVEDLKRRA